MFRFYENCIRVCAVSLVMLAICCIPGYCLSLISPSENQIVREMVKITMPRNVLPTGFIVQKGETVAEKGRPFVSLLLVDEKGKQFVAALAPESGTQTKANITFFWNSKAPYREPSKPKEDKFFKDGKYALIVQLHDVTGNVSDSASVNIDLRNKIARSNPAPALSLVHKLNYGQSSTYDLRSDVQVYEMISGIGLPILGGLGISGDSKVILNVEDVRDNGDRLIRYRIGRDAWISASGRKTVLFQSADSTPQLYRLITKTGRVVNPNVFSRQGKFTISDVLTMLPAKPVKEGESWPCSFMLKVEGITDMIALSGTSMLDSVEWQDGHECAKIISRLSGNMSLSMNDGKIKSEDVKADAQVITYFAYKSGKMVKNEITLDVPAVILPGAGGVSSEPGASAVTQASGNPYEDEDMIPGGAPMGGNYASTSKANKSASKATKSEEPGAKKGSVQISLVVRLER